MVLTKNRRVESDKKKKLLLTAGLLRQRFLYFYFLLCSSSFIIKHHDSILVEGVKKKIPNHAAVILYTSFTPFFCTPQYSCFAFQNSPALWRLRKDLNLHAQASVVAPRQFGICVAVMAWGVNKNYAKWRQSTCAASFVARERERERVHNSTNKSCTSECNYSLSTSRVSE